MPTTETSPQAVWLALIELVMDHKHLWREQVESRLDVPFSRVRALRRLVRGPRTQRELAEQLNVDAPAASVIVGDLVRRGLVVRRPHPTDGRAKLVEATAAGHAWMDEVRGLPGGTPPALDALTEPELCELARLVAKIRAADDS